MEDDHSRKFWAARLENETDDNVVDGMKHLLHDKKYDSLLTDNMVVSLTEETLL
jgi:hypothetical protein